MVREAVQCDGKNGVGEDFGGVSGGEFALAAAAIRRLPGWDQVADERVVHPLGNFVAERRYIGERREDAFTRPTGPGESLNRGMACGADIIGGVEAKDAAIAGIARVKKDVLAQ